MDISMNEYILHIICQHENGRISTRTASQKPSNSAFESSWRDLQLFENQNTLIYWACPRRALNKTNILYFTSLDQSKADLISRPRIYRYVDE